MKSSAQGISFLLHAWCDGDRAALDKLVLPVYDKLHHLAHHHMLQERANHTLKTTRFIRRAECEGNDRAGGQLRHYKPGLITRKGMVVLRAEK
jgi:hypothetical protein